MSTMDAMGTMDRTGRIHIQPGMDVFDMDAHKIGSVVHVHERAVSPGAVPGAGSDEDIIEVKTGFLGLGKHLYVPRSAVRDVTEGGVFLSGGKEKARELGWETKPADLTSRAAVLEGARAEGADEDAAPEASTWDEAVRYYRARCFERYGNDANWERYEPRYRFAWDMGEAPDLKGKSWADAAPEMRQRWEVLHPDTPWDGAVDTVQDAWEHSPRAKS